MERWGAELMAIGAVSGSAGAGLGDSMLIFPDAADPAIRASITGSDETKALARQGLDQALFLAGITDRARTAFMRVVGKWLGVPSCFGSQIRGPCSRIDLKYADIDVQAMYPAGEPPKAENWTLEAFLKAAEDCHRGGFPFGIGLGETADSVSTAGAIFRSFGAELVDARGNVTARTDAVRQALDFYKRLIAFLPSNVAAWDDASNNKWLIAGKGALIFNPPSAWAVAKRDAPQVAKQCWTHGFPAGPKGFTAYAPFFGVFGGSRRTRMPRRACSYISPNLPQSRNLLWPAAAMTCPHTRALRRWKSGRTRDHRREHFFTIQTPTTTKIYLSQGLRPRQR
jgi:hypothetical protein